MPTVTVSERVAAPVDQVFAAFTDLEHSSGRVAGIKSIELLTPGGFQLGTRWRETREVFGRLDSADMEITAFEKNKTYTITHHKVGARVDTVFAFEPAGTSTTVNIEFTFDGRGLPPGLLTPIGWAVGSKIREVLSDDLADLKRAIEAMGKTI